MAGVKSDNLRVLSQGFYLLREREKREGRRISLDSIAQETGLSRMTVRRYMHDPESEVTNSPVGAAAVLSQWLNIPIGEFLRVEDVTDTQLGLPEYEGFDTPEIHQKIREARAELDAGLGITHEETMRRVRERIDAMNLPYKQG